MKKHIRIDVDDDTGTPVTIHDALLGYTTDLTGSMTYSASHTSGADIADMAFDNNTTTKWTAGITTRPQWIECNFGFGNKKKIEKITLRSWDYFDNIPDSFELRASNNTTDWDTLLSDNMPSTITTTTTFTFSNSIEYRYYRVYVLTTHTPAAPIILTEIEMMEVIKTYTADLTSGMTYDAGNEESGAAENAFDNNTSTHWIATSYTPQWIECDFGTGNVKKIQKITLSSMVAGGSIADEFELRGSNNGTDWSTIINDSMPNNTSVTTTFKFNNNNNYRYYRIYIISTYDPAYSVILTEIEMMEELYTKYCISVEYPHNFGENLSTINCKFRTSSNDDELTEGRLIQIWSKATTPVGNADADRVFKGYIDSSRMEGKIISVTAKDFLVKAQWKRGTENEDYDDQTSIKTIFSDLCTLAGLTVSNSSTATSPVNMEQFYCNNTNVFERMTQLANTTGWYFYYDPTTTQTVYFQPKSELTLQEYYFGGANNNMLSIPNWNCDAKDLVNDIDVVGGNNKINKTWSITPDGSSWYQIEDETLEDVTVYGTGTTVGAVGKTTWSFPNEYSLTGNGYIIFNLDMIPDSGVGTLKADYSFSQTGKNSNAANSTSKTDFQTREGVSHKRDMVNSTDLAAYASNIVSNTFWGKPVSDVTFNANTKLITPIVGSMANVTDVVSGKSITYASNNSIIISQNDTWPRPGSQVRISTKPIKKPDLITTVQDTVSKLSNEFNKIDWKNYMKMDGSTSFQDNIDIGKKQLLNAALHKVADSTARGNINAVEGMIVYQQDTDIAYIYDGAAWDVMGSGTSDHGSLSGLADDDHAQYLLTSGIRAMANNLQMGDNDIIGVDTIQATNNQHLIIKVSSGQSIIFQVV